MLDTKSDASPRRERYHAEDGQYSRDHFMVRESYKSLSLSPWEGDAGDAVRKEGDGR